MGAAEWTAAGTIALTIVTAGLWIAAQTQLREQRRMTSLLSKPFFTIEAVHLQYVWLRNKQVHAIVFELKNSGDGSAWNVHAESKPSSRGISLKPPHFFAQVFIGKDQHFRIEVPFSEPLETITIPLELDITVTFDDLEKKRNRMHYITSYTPEMGEWDTVLISHSL